MFFSLQCFICIVSGELFESFTGVWELSSSTIEEALDHQPDLLLEFYSPKCGHCKEFTPHYNGLGEHMLVNESLHIARIDVEHNPGVMSEYGIESVPTLLFFRNRFEFVFTGVRTAIEIYKWSKKLSSRTFHVFANHSEFKQASLKNETFVYFGAAKHKLRKQFDQVFEQDGSMEYGVILSLKNSELKKSAPGVILKTEYAEKVFSLTDESSELFSFVQLSRGKKIHQWSEETKDLILNQKVRSLIFFFDEGMSDKYLPSVEYISGKYHEDILVTFADMNSNSTQYLQEYFGLNKDHQPLTVIIDSRLEYGKFVTFSCDKENVETFFKNWENGQLKPFYKSQLNLKKEIEKDVFVLTGNNFEDLVYDKNKDFVVFFYNVGHTECDKALIMFERAAYELSAVPDLRFGKIIIDLNEVNDVKIKGIPAIKIFTKGNKKGVNYEGHMGKFRLFKFIKDNLGP
jgi:protein disulfide-isomerase A1